jgi:hypothetical protein
MYGWIESRLNNATKANTTAIEKLAKERHVQDLTDLAESEEDEEDEDEEDEEVEDEEDDEEEEEEEDEDGEVHALSGINSIVFTCLHLLKLLLEQGQPRQRQRYVSVMHGKRGRDDDVYDSSEDDDEVEKLPKV